jgi:DNA-binding IclR family transcriptional regulator
VLEVLSDAETPLPLPELCARLGLHRSVVYRLLRTLEEHGLAARDDDGKVRLGLGLAALARSVQPDLRDAALPELTRVANAVGMTAFLTVLMDGEVVTLVSTQPHRGGGIVAQQPGSRHRLDVGAPGAAIRSQLSPDSLDRLGLSREPELQGDPPHAISRDEVIPGLQSVAVPLVVEGQPPAALAVVHVVGDNVKEQELVQCLHDAAGRVVAELR